MYIFFIDLFRKYKYIVICIIGLISIGLYYIFLNDNTSNNVLESDINDLEQLPIKTEDTLELKKIDIKGAVNNPGVYEFKNGDRVEDAIVMAGGLNNNADTRSLNLSKTLVNEMIIVIYTTEEIKKYEKNNEIQIIEEVCNCPVIINDACINEDNGEISTKININKATIEELTKLTGIGKSKAEAIVKYREDNNGFKSIDELTNVSGIGASTFEKIKDNITI